MGRTHRHLKIIIHKQPEPSRGARILNHAQEFAMTDNLESVIEDVNKSLPETFQVLGYMRSKTDKKRLWIIYKICNEVRINRYKHVLELKERNPLETEKESNSDVLLDFSEYIYDETLRQECVKTAMLLKLEA